MTGRELLGQWVRTSRGLVGRVVVYDPLDRACTYAIHAPDFDPADAGVYVLQEGYAQLHPERVILAGLPAGTKMRWVYGDIYQLSPEELARCQLAHGQAGQL